MNKEKDNRSLSQGFVALFVLHFLSSGPLESMQIRATFKLLS